MGHSEHGLGWMGPGRQREGELAPVQGLATALAAPVRKAMQSHWQIGAQTLESDSGERRWPRAVC